jgi:Tol biopolymer transport system component
MSASNAGEPRCFDENTLLAFVEGSLPEGQLDRVNVHVAECAQCRKIVGALTSREGETGAGDSSIPPLSSETVPARPLPPGAMVARYRIESLVGAGAMGAVYAAYDPDLERRVALKLLEPGDGSHELRTRLLREAQAMARVTHAHVVAVYDVGTWRQRLFIAMEFVRGGTLRAWLTTRPRSVSEILDVLLRAGRGLAEAHAAGLVHRDFKPDNVLVGDDGRVCVTDFGLARPARDGFRSDPSRAEPPSSAAVDSRSTRTGVLVGTPAYMAPEQLDCAAADERSDEFAFCVTLYEALHGRRPFEGATVAALRESIRHGCPALESPHARVPARVDAALRRGLSYRPSDRYASMNELCDALERALVEPRRARSRRIALGVALASVAALGSAVVWVARSRANRPALGGGASPPGHDLRLAVTGVHRVTFGEDCEEFPVFTPDGTRVLYDGTVGANSYIYAMDLASGRTERLTEVAGWDFAPSISPDGTRVAFLRMTGGEAGTYLASVDDMRAPRFLRTGSLRPSWSKNGRSLWAGDRRRPVRVRADSGEVERELRVPSEESAERVLEIGDRVIGLFSATLASSHGIGGGGVRAYRSDDTWEPLIEGELAEVLVPLPGERHALVAGIGQGDESRLLTIALAGASTPAPASSEIHPTTGMALSPDGRRVVWSTCRTVARLARVDLAGRTTPVGARGDWVDEDVQAIPGRNAVVVLSTRTGRAQPWVIDLEGTVPDRLIAVPDLQPRAVAVSPDGRWLAVSVYREGIALLPIDGSGPRRWVTRDGSDDHPSFRSDRDEVLFTRQLPDGRSALMAAPITGGSARTLVAEGARNPVASPKDSRVAFMAGATDDTLLPTLLDPETGKTQPLSADLEPARYFGLTFSTDGRSVVVLRGTQELGEFDVATGHKIRQIRLADDLNALTYVGKGIVIVAMQQWIGDLWLGDAEVTAR